MGRLWLNRNIKHFFSQSFSNCACQRSLRKKLSAKTFLTKRIENNGCLESFKRVQFQVNKFVFNKLKLAKTLLWFFKNHNKRRQGIKRINCQRDQSSLSINDDAINTTKLFDQLKQPFELHFNNKHGWWNVSSFLIFPVDRKHLCSAFHLEVLQSASY